MTALTATKLRKLKVGLFAERNSVDEALAYGTKMFPNDKPAVTTAMMVLYNTLLELLAKEAEKEKA